MTGTVRTTAELDPHRRKLLFRAWHRGTREMDLIIGGFADALTGYLTDTAARAAASAEGLKQAARFDWDRINDAVLQRYREIIAA